VKGVRIDCWCITCDETIAEAQRLNGDFSSLRWFIFCPDCGNKRCPRAAHHDRACTGSNEPGQPGSAYPAFPAWDEADYRRDGDQALTALAASIRDYDERKEEGE
jgi:hypothetical protein